MQSQTERGNREWFEIAERVLPGAGLGGYALAEDIRFVFAEGSGARVRDADGREFIDYVGGAGALILGPSSVYCTKGFKCLRRILADSTMAISGETLPLVQISRVNLS